MNQNLLFGGQKGSFLSTGFSKFPLYKIMINNDQNQRRVIRWDATIYQQIEIDKNDPFCPPNSSSLQILVHFLVNGYLTLFWQMESSGEM